MAKKKVNEDEEVKTNEEEALTLDEARKDNSGEDKPVKLSEEETDEVEESGEKRHGVAPTTGNIVKDEEEANRRNQTGLPVNGDTNDREMNEEDQKKLEDELSTDGFVARVITSTGDYLKVKFFKDNKVFTTFKGKNGDVEKAKQWLKEARDRSEQATS